MYNAIIQCHLCGFKHSFKEEELWRIIRPINELEICILNGRARCDACNKIGPVEILIQNEALNSVFFEKIISPICYKGNTIANINKIKPTMDEPCLPCCATGKLEIQYKAHKSEGSFKGVLTEECPICQGKGYIK